LSYRDIELMMAERGLSLTYETIRYCSMGFLLAQYSLQLAGLFVFQEHANGLRISLGFRSAVGLNMD
jgi:hypothetical protein